MPDSPPPRNPSRICVCVMMNHPFPANIPLLRQIYEKRFGTVRFLIPFERLSDPDVITVYRGSYTHAAYLTDAWPILSQIDCDYYLVVHDDVLMNPKLGEENFLDVFKLGPDDGFIPRVHTMPAELGRWIWYFGFVPKLLHPKSLLFGSGIETANLQKYLPSAETLEKAMAACGVTATRGVCLDSEAMEDVARVPSRVLLHGLAANLPPSDAQNEVDSHSLEIERQLVQTMLDAHAAAHTASLSGGDQKTSVTFPIPIVEAGYATDFYILPKSGLRDFSHYMGVAGAAGLFVEIIAPTLLYACCSRVWTAGDFGLDFSGFDSPKKLEWFDDVHAIAMHPFKLSAFKGTDRQNAFAELLDAVELGVPASSDIWSRIGDGTPLDMPMGPGWHSSEPWGRWASAPEAVIQIFLPKPAPICLRLRGPTHPKLPHIAGSIAFNDRQIAFSATWPDSDVVLTIDRLTPDTDGIAKILLRTDTMVNPVEFEPDTSDRRILGFGLIAAERLPEHPQT